MPERPDHLPNFDTRPTVRIFTGMPETDSVVELSDSAFRLMIEAICYCGRQETDGRIPKGQMTRMATKTTATRELAKAGHIEDTGDHWVLADYLRWNRAKTEINSFRASKGQSGARGAHMRWHVPRRQRVAECAFCYPEGVADAKPSA